MYQRKIAYGSRGFLDLRYSAGSELRQGVVPRRGDATRGKWVRHVHARSFRRGRRPDDRRVSQGVVPSAHARRAACHGRGMTGSRAIAREELSLFAFTRGYHPRLHSLAQRPRNRPFQQPAFPRHDEGPCAPTSTRSTGTTTFFRDPARGRDRMIGTRPPTCRRTTGRPTWAAHRRARELVRGLGLEAWSVLCVIFWKARTS